MSYQPGPPTDAAPSGGFDSEARQRARAALRQKRRRAATLRWTVGASLVLILAVTLWFGVVPLVAARAMSRALQAAANATSLQLKARVTVGAGAGGRSQQTEIPFELAYQRPNCVKLTIGKDAAFFKAYCDGKFLQIALPAAHTVVKSPAPADLATLQKGAAAGQPIPAPDFSGVKIRPGIHSRSEWLKDRQAPDGTTPFTLTTKDGERLVVWVDLHQGLPKMVAIDQLDTVTAKRPSGTAQAGKAGLPSGMEMRLVVTFDELKVNPQLPASTFEYKPAQTTKVLTAATPEQAGQLLMQTMLSNPAAMQELERSFR